MRPTPLWSAAVVLLTAATVTAQHTPADPASVERGKQLQVTHCGFCHGSNARGGQQGPDLTRSALVQSDEGGQQLGEYLKVGRPEKNMPKFDLPEKDVKDLATFLHAAIESVSARGRYKILNILVGDAKKGQAFFTGAGKCANCHSATGDLQGIASRFEDPVELQQRLVMPRGRRWGPPQGQKPVPPFLEPMAVKATVALTGGETFTGPLVSLTDFGVVVYDAEQQQSRSFLRHDGVPKVTLSDPLQAHVDMLRKWTDDDIHNMTAFLATLKQRP